jgi:hypothetical protein
MSLKDTIKEIEQVQYFLNHGTKALIEKYGRNLMIDGNHILYLDYNNVSNKAVLMVDNKTYERKIKIVIRNSPNDTILRKLNITTNKLNSRNSALSVLKQSAEKETLYRTKEEKQMFYNHLNCRTKDGVIVKRASNLNQCFQQYNIPYRIETISEYNKDNRRYYPIWKITEIKVT